MIELFVLALLALHGLACTMILALLIWRSARQRDLREEFTVPDKRPGSRVAGWQRLRQLMKASLTLPQEEPGITFFDRCTQGVIRTLPSLPRDDRKRDDVDTDAEDHPGDGVRYRAVHRVQRLGLVKVRWG